MSDKKKMQLGMNPSTASNRLVKDVLWKLIQQTGQSTCCKCGELMSRETFSIEHVTPWLDSSDPVGLYFDLDNVSFSHLRCNREDARPRIKTLVHGTTTGYNYGCKCDDCKLANTKATYTRQKRWRESKK